MLNLHQEIFFIEGKKSSASTREILHTITMEKLQNRLLASTTIWSSLISRGGSNLSSARLGLGTNKVKSSVKARLGLKNVFKSGLEARLGLDRTGLELYSVLKFQTYAGALLGFRQSILVTLIFHFLLKDVVPEIEIEILAAFDFFPVSTYTGKKERLRSE